MNELISALKNPESVSYAQLIPMEMMTRLNESAKGNEVSLDIEITMRLLATMLDPDIFDKDFSIDEILNQHDLHEDFEAEFQFQRHSPVPVIH